MESLIFTPDSAKSVQPAKTEAAERDALPISQPKIQEETKLNAEEADNELNLANVERPVDLYKVLVSFSVMAHLSYYEFLLGMCSCSYFIACLDILVQFILCGH